HYLLQVNQTLNDQNKNHLPFYPPEPASWHLNAAGSSDSKFPFGSPSTGSPGLPSPVRVHHLPSDRQQYLLHGCMQIRPFVQIVAPAQTRVGSQIPHRSLLENPPA